MAYGPWRIFEAPREDVDGDRPSHKVKNFSYFLDGTSGYAIGEGEVMDTFRTVSMFTPFYNCEVHEIVPYEKGKETLRTLLKSQIAAAHKGE